MVRAVVVGTREITKQLSGAKELVVNSIESLAPEPDEIVSGGARGVDTIAKQYAMERNIEYTEFPARWGETEGKPESEIRERNDGSSYWAKAGIERNREMIEYGDVCIAIWDGESSGTKSTIGFARSILGDGQTHVVKYTPQVPTG